MLAAGRLASGAVVLELQLAAPALVFEVWPLSVEFWFDHPQAVLLPETASANPLCLVALVQPEQHNVLLVHAE